MEVLDEKHSKQVTASRYSFSRPVGTLDLGLQKRRPFYPYSLRGLVSVLQAVVQA